MFDGVVNHVSSKSRWFQEFLGGNPQFKDFFISYSSPEELTLEARDQIFRPRTSDVLTRFDTINGPFWVWTTFSEDQIDLNYKNPAVLIHVLEILLLYVRHGADLIRLDAVGFIWAESGTRCIHLEQAHSIVKLFRDTLDIVAPGVALVTETNVPHEENISYFGDGTDEAQMIYNFSLPPLVLHTFYSEDSEKLSRWAAGLEKVSDTATYFNFLDSHDGIGILGAKGILSENELSSMIEKAVDHGGLISYKTSRTGEQEPYEINTTWFSALNYEDDGEDIAFKVKRFVASRAVALVLRGVPGIYLHSLIGTENDIKAVLTNNSNRDINRTVIDGQSITQALAEPLSKISRIGREFGRLISIRTRQQAFHPNGDQVVLFLDSQVFSVLRISPDRKQIILSLVNISSATRKLEIPLKQLRTTQSSWTDLVSQMKWEAFEEHLFISLMPYDIIWLTPDD
jgi:sucrose phosphorylase